MNLVLFLTSFVTVQAVSNYKFLKIENCSSAAESPLTIENCVVAGTKVNVSIIFNRPVDKIGIHVALYNIVNSEAHQIFKMPRVDWCDLMKGKNAKGMMKLVFDAIKDSIPELIQQCPYEGPYQVINGMIASKSLFIFPSGTFRVDLKVYVDDNFVVKPILTLELFD